MVVSSKCGKCHTHTRAGCARLLSRQCLAMHALRVCVRREARTFASSSIVNSPGLPILKGPLLLPSMTAAKPAMRSLTYWNERVWLPSPYTVMGVPVRACDTKLDTTRPSSSAMRGPYVLNMRTMRTCGHEASRRDGAEAGTGEERGE
jgi:hypothetical protein